MKFWYRDEIRIDVLASDADPYGAKTWTPGAISRARVEDKVSTLRLPDGTQITSTLAIITDALCPAGARVWVAPASTSGAPRRFGSFVFGPDKGWREPLFVKAAHMPGVGRVTEIYF